MKSAKSFAFQMCCLPTNILGWYHSILEDFWLHLRVEMCNRNLFFQVEANSFSYYKENINSKCLSLYSLCTFKYVCVFVVCELVCFWYAIMSIFLYGFVCVHILVGVHVCVNRFLKVEKKIMTNCLTNPLFL